MMAMIVNTIAGIKAAEEESRLRLSDKLPMQGFCHVAPWFFFNIFSQSILSLLIL